MILVTGDLHFSANKRDSYRWVLLKWLRQQAREHDVEAVIIMGDLTEVKDNHPAELVNRIVDEFQKLTAVCPVIFIRGNHDWLNDPNCPFFAFLGRLEDVTWINTPTDGESIPELKGYGRSILLPHSTNPLEEWKDLPLKDYKLAFCHQTFKGVLSEQGKELDGAPTNLFSEDALVLSGDIHKPQRLGNIVYAGSPYTVDFGDEYQGRVILLPRKSKFKPLGYSGPQKVLKEISSLEELEKDDGDIIPGDVVKVRYNLTLDQRNEWPDIQKKIRAWGTAEGVNVYTTQPVLPDTSRKRRKQLTKNIRSDEQVLDDFCARYGIDKETKEVGHKLLSSV